MVLVFKLYTLIKMKKTLEFKIKYLLKREKIIEELKNTTEKHKSFMRFFFVLVYLHI